MQALEVYRSKLYKCATVSLLQILQYDILLHHSSWVFSKQSVTCDTDKLLNLLQLHFNFDIKRIRFILLRFVKRNDSSLLTYLLTY